MIDCSYLKFMNLFIFLLIFLMLSRKKILCIKFKKAYCFLLYKNTRKRRQLEYIYLKSNFR